MPNWNPLTWGRSSDVAERAVEPTPISTFQDYVDWQLAQGGTFPSYTTTWGADPAEPVGDNFVGLIQGALKANGLVGGLTRIRCSVFAEVRAQYQHMVAGRPADLWGDRSLERLERPWVGGTMGDLLFKAALYADLAGNAYLIYHEGEFVFLRPDWVDILIVPRMDARGTNGRGVQIGWKKVGYAYFHGGNRSNDPAVFLPDEVMHYAPQPDPEATYRGMSWVTPVIREIQADIQTTKHKLKFFENAATPNLSVSMAKEVTPEQFEQFIEIMDRKHVGVENAYKTLYTAGGADVSVIGANMRELDFKVTQGAGETRVAMAAGVHPVIAGLSEGLQGSSLNAGNFGAARRIFADVTMAPLWRNFFGSLQVLVEPPAGSRLWYDGRDVPFLQEDRTAASEIQTAEAATIRTLLESGFTPDSVIRAVQTGEWNDLEHTGFYSVQLQTLPDPAADPGTSNLGDGGEAEPTTKTARTLSAAEVLQKVYLSVGTVITKDEARKIVNDAGANLEIPAPAELDAPAPTPVTDQNDEDQNDDVTPAADDETED